MRISSIKFKNYRQFRDIELNLKRMPGKKDLHVIVGIMGTGKSNLLNAINWCLYGEEPFLSREDSKEFPLLNIKVIGKAQHGAEYIICVEINACSGDRHITFIREEFCQVENKVELSPHACTSTRKIFKVVLSKEDGSSEIFEGEKAQEKVDLIVPYGIKEFYFFDGERLDKYFKEATGQNIRNAIYQISQIHLLDRTQKHLEKAVAELQKDAGKLSPEIEATRTKLETAGNDLKKHEGDIAKCNNQIASAKEGIEEIQENLNGLPETDELEAERAELKNLLKEKEALQKKKILKKNDLLFSRGVNILLWTAIEKTVTIIREKHQNEELPPTIDRALLEKLLEDKRCICKTDIIPGSPESKAITELLDTIKLSSEVAQQLMLIENPLNVAIEHIISYPSELQEIAQEISTMETELDNISGRITEIDKRLAAYDLIKIRAWISERKQLEETIVTNQRRLGMLEHLKDDSAKLVIQLKKTLDEELKKESKFADLNKDINFAENAIGVLKKASKGILEKIRKEIEKKTEENFFKLHWKKKGQTYKAVKINRDYTVSPVHSLGYDAISILSGGEREVLALSFSTGLHEISGFDSAVVVDRPFAMVSGPPRKKIAQIFSTISEQRQVVLLLTPEDYGSDVQTVIDKELSSRISLKLSKDEREISFKEI